MSSPLEIRSPRGLRVALGALLPLATTAALVVACERQVPEATDTFYDRSIDPILDSGCSTSPSGSACHQVQDRRGNALGNLSLDSFEGIDKRRDLLVPYGPYAMPNLLLKALPPFGLSLTNYDSDEPIFITTDVAHAGGSLLDVTSVSFTQLQRWIARGATENNLLPAADRVELSPCNEAVGSDPSFDPDADPDSDDYSTFQRTANAVVGERCAAGNCHGSPGNSMYLTCGATDEQTRWNYFVVGDYVSENPRSSEILRRALDPADGGTFHEGGTVFESASDSGYTGLFDWAREKGGPTHIPEEPGFAIFAERVQPMLVKKGCMQLGCHSPTMGHDYRLRGGSAGHFSLPATRRNYELTLEQVALESSDPNASRLLRKNLAPGAGRGTIHRGGSLLSGSGDPAACDFEAALGGPLDEQDPYCVIAAWIAEERRERMGDPPGMTHLVYVRVPRGTGPRSPQDFERYSPGAQLLRVELTVDAEGWPSAGAPQSLLPLCGLDSTTTSVRRPSVSWDGTRIAFSARTGEGEPLRIYVIEGDSCELSAAIDAAPVDDEGRAVPDNGSLVHNFDPVFGPDGRIVFASTRGNVMNTEAFDYRGPQRSPADPSRLNSNLYILEGDGIRQLTFLLDQEMTPAFMTDGRLIFTTEKRAPGFYQLAGRRMNLDGGDYHPLFGQRSSIGFHQFSEIVELSDRNFAAIVSDPETAQGAGALAIINRSLGIDQRSDDDLDYPMDASARNYPNEDFYQHSLRLINARASGRIDETRGAYRSPAPLLDGKLVVSYAPDATNLRQIDGSFDLYVVDATSGERRALLADSEDLLWPAAVFARAPRPVFRSRIDEPNGATVVHTQADRRSYSDITYLDLGLLSTLMFQNTRSGRPIPPSATPVEFWEHLPPSEDVTSLDDDSPYLTGDEFGKLYVRRRLLGSVVPDASDGSARVRLRGGVPFSLATHIQLEGDAEPTLHHQREANQFYPGEWARQSFPRQLFDGVCGNCHGSISGLESDIATNPDILTRASTVAARGSDPTEVMGRGQAEGPNFP